MAEEKGEAGPGRTDLAEDRTVLAHERSFAGWVRTGMAAVGLGLGFHVLFRAIEPAWVPKAIATGFLLVAIFIFLSAQLRACSIISNLETHTVAQLKPMRIRLLSWTLIVLTLGLVLAIWLLGAF